MQMVRNSRLCGHAIDAYLQSKGFPEVAVHFVRDPKIRFRLALACGTINAALECGFTLEKQKEESKCEIWGQLGCEALRQGNYHVVEMSYQKTKNFDRLTFLYFITGDIEKLKKMQKIANVRNDIMGQYHSSSFLGDIEKRVKLLEVSVNKCLAYISAKLHGLDETSKSIKAAIVTSGGSVEGLLEKLGNSSKSSGCLLQPPITILREANWPTL